MHPFNVVSLVGCKRTLLTHVQLLIELHEEVLDSLWCSAFAQTCEQQPLCFSQHPSLEEMRQCCLLPAPALQIISQCASWTQEIFFFMTSVSGA